MRTASIPDLLEENPLKKLFGRCPVVLEKFVGLGEGVEHVHGVLVF